ncbi:class I SAM-dependent methyltransferase [Desulfomicrobium baculatum]|uniref:Methyltransferase type 12 n=1 Tax=Desulfomicrobium baculatum (strain DSM 4028 / VKM B-1378 / X) TaxID=525897 RepID=C7LTA5_DESBD|nr:class I SAM-dependent methyltransferase [Desulfomicrobium baculatum]ACU88329.1 methyltransferase type 12 [Desulfomicrobium baculatum DSM 4028]
MTRPKTRPKPVPGSTDHAPGRRPVLPWPLPALIAWSVCWALFLSLSALQIPVLWSLILATSLGFAAGLRAASAWRKLFISAGFPLSLAASNLGAGLSPWAWLIPLGLLLLLYPMSAWRDAPLFPTPHGILDGLDTIAPLKCTDRILDAGCGLGAGLAELHRVYPVAQLDGLEKSWPLRFLCAWRCPFARVRHADIWKEDWSGYSMVYMFQRPESMGPAAAKARQELSQGSWLVSLEFEAPTLKPVVVLRNRADKPVWVYRMG